jgi:iron(III) transport system ATP-binding protein
MATSHIIGHVENGDYGLAIAYGPLLRELPHRDLRPGPAHVALRPEAIALVPERRPDALEGEVKKATYLGSHMEYTVATALGELFVIDPRVDRPLAPGSAVSALLGAREITLVRD